MYTTSTGKIVIVRVIPDYTPTTQGAKAVKRSSTCSSTCFTSCCPAGWCLLVACFVWLSLFVLIVYMRKL